MTLNKMLLDAACRHLHEVLGVPVPAVKPWANAQELPYFLKDAFQYGEIELLGQPVVLALAPTEPKHSLGDMRTWQERMRGVAGRPVVYVIEALASYERRRLIELKVPFIVPGNQLYIPDLGLDLREYFRKRTPVAEALSPSAQAMLITALLRRPWESQWQPARTAAELGYTPMTLSRTVRELTGAGLASLHAEGRLRWLRFEDPPQAIWEHAKPVLRSPVRNTFWVADATVLSQYPRRLAGLSALAHHSMLAEPRWPVYAIAAAHWKAAVDAGVCALPEPRLGAQELQVWSYSPTLVPDASTVDPLSLTLSLRDNTEDRIQLALDELQGQFPW